jgi:hypothetical protein
MAMTKDEIIAQIKATTFTCKGRLSPTALAHKAELLASPDTRPLADAIDRANRGRSDDDPIVIQLVQPDNPRLPQVAHFSNGSVENYSPHPLCGSTFMQALLLAGPFDGEVREYQCPRCKVIGLYQTPRVQEDGHHG